VTSKERVLKALDHQEPDRVPVGEWGIDHDTVEKVIGHKTYWRARAEITKALWAGKRDEVVESYKKDLVELIERLDQDLVPVHLVPPKGLAPTKVKQIDKETWEDEEGRIFKYTSGNDAILCIKSNPVRSFKSKEELREYFESHLVKDFGFKIRDKNSSGPFSLASSLCGMEKLFILTMENPDYVKHLMKFCTKVLKVFGKAYLNVGLGIVVFDSVCSLVSPKTYKELIMPYHKELMSFFHQEGLAHRPLIIGGNTLPISKYLLEVDANQILCDFNVDLEEYLKIISGEKIAIRANVDPKLIQKGPIERIKEAGCKLLKKGSSYPKFILGTGVISYNTLRENILALRKIVE